MDLKTLGGRVNQTQVKHEGSQKAEEQHKRKDRKHLRWRQVTWNLNIRERNYLAMNRKTRISESQRGTPGRVRSLINDELLHLHETKQTLLREDLKNITDLQRTAPMSRTLQLLEETSCSALHTPRFKEMVFVAWCIRGTDTINNHQRFWDVIYSRTAGTSISTGLRKLVAKWSNHSLVIF